MSGDARWLRRILIAGIILRGLVFFFAAPENRDSHFEVIKWIAQKHTIPTARQVDQAFQPPLYHILMAPLAALGGRTLVCFGSFLISSVNLLLICRLVQRKELFPPFAQRPKPAVIALAFAAFLPQYVMSGHFISNDTLAILIGTMLSGAVFSYVANDGPDARQPFGIAILIGLGLVTKGTFLLTAAAMTLLIAFVELGRRKNIWPMMRHVAIFCVIWLVLGCYKYVDNAIHTGHAFYHNLDAHPAWADAQRGVYKGWRTIVDINPLSLIRRPILREGDVSESYPQLFFGTFWYQHMRASSFVAGEYGYGWIGSCIYVAAIIPTIVFLVGIGSAMRKSLRWLRLPNSEPRDAVLATSLLLLASNFVLVIASGIHYDVRGGFNARLCLPSMVPMLVLFGEGLIIVIASRSRVVWQIVRASCVAVILLSLIFFWVEFAFAGHLLPRGPHMDLGLG